MEKIVLNGDFGAVVIQIDVAAMLLVGLCAWGANVAWRWFVRHFDEGKL